ncbi:MAG: chemotaxis response regulator protein-glutamate methylesterase [Succinivibrionaceae bacterium]|nr:chemotaxis response regulator protein-glutamate methylesterase [Succinivibrionaceae bacterium]
MPIRVLIVDDSSFFRRRINEIIVKDPSMEVAGTAANGKEAVEKVAELKPDVITMDVEMPVMNGIDAVRAIMSKNPTPIIMFSSLTEEGASATFNALDAGALDFITKNFDDIARNRDEAMDLIRSKIRDISRQKFQANRIARTKYGVSSFGSSAAPAAAAPAPAPAPASAAPQQTRSVLGSFRRSSDTIAAGTARTSFSTRSQTTPGQTASRTSVLPERQSAASRLGSQTSAFTPSTPGGLIPPSKPVCDVPEITRASVKPSGKRYKLLAIGSSTGGPVALQEVLTNLPADFPVPIILVQHMPSTFTASFASRLDKLCKISVCEAKNNDQLKPGCAYLAPGGMQLYVEGRSGQGVIKIRESEPHMCYRPCVDISFESITRSYGGNVLGVILTGMGADGREGCRKLKSLGATIWAQNEETSVIYGMPQAVVNAGIASAVIPLKEVAGCITREIMG